MAPWHLWTWCPAPGKCGETMGKPWGDKMRKLKWKPPKTFYKKKMLQKIDEWKEQIACATAILTSQFVRNEKCKEQKQVWDSINESLDRMNQPTYSCNAIHKQQLHDMSDGKGSLPAQNEVKTVACAACCGVSTVTSASGSIVLSITNSSEVPQVPLEKKQGANRKQ